MSQPDLFSASLPPAPDRVSALERLKGFTPSMGRAYAARRNHDLGPQDRSNISCLSAHVRHRLVLEAELAQAALSAHGYQAAEKFIQEVCWRTYWKGWLELRPSVWADYKRDCDAAWRALAEDAALRQRYNAAIDGRTGIEGFDAWARELVECGYLHNHARMWFASIWIFTLKLPWVLGADHFLRHLIDGDAASNTLSWRWVGGLQTVGKTYLARADNIATYTQGRFAPDPASLAQEAPPLSADKPHPEPGQILPGQRPELAQPCVLLLHEEDLHAESWGLDGADIRGVLYAPEAVARGDQALGDAPTRFTQAALADGARRAAEHYGVEALGCEGETEILSAGQGLGAQQIITQRPQQGPVRDQLAPLERALEQAGMPLVGLVRDWDQAFHPYATKGFFKFKTAIPKVFDQLGLS